MVTGYKIYRTAGIILKPITDNAMRQAIIFLLICLAGIAAGAQQKADIEVSYSEISFLRMARNENTSTIFWQMRDSQNSSIPVQKRLIRCYLLQKVLPISKGTGGRNAGHDGARLHRCGKPAAKGGVCICVEIFCRLHYDSL